ncbi:MAG TPA: prephenate dehydratase [Abditibacteriaceae bacterium]|nr:prephenate dehydratase [Abditibacteriaceae bacterium]
MDQEDLSPERAAIDAIDSEIMSLLNRRVEEALKVGAKKKALGLPLHDPARERSIYERLRDLNAQLHGQLPDVAVTAIYREIISACRNAEHPVTVAFLGPAGTNTQEAAVQYFGSAFTSLPCGTPDEVCQSVVRDARAGGADYGVLAIENSIQGIVSANLDLLANSGLTISAEIELVIHHCLLSNTELGRITVVYSHEQGLAQCRNWLNNHLPGATLVPVTSTARGAEMATREAGAAAVGSALAANIYGLQIVASNIEDLTSNKTRFFVVAAGPPPSTASGRDKTSLAFQVPHRPGSLVEVLAVFQRHGVNLSMIQSRPSRQQAWEYRFFADLQAHRDDASLQAALLELQEHTVSYKILGSYPEAG